MATPTQNEKLGAFCAAAGVDLAATRARAATCGTLFDALGHIHGLTKTMRPLVEAAAVLSCLPGEDASRALARLRASEPKAQSLLPGLGNDTLDVLQEAVRLATAPPEPSALKRELLAARHDAARQVGARAAALVRLASGITETSAGPPAIEAVCDGGEGIDIWLSLAPGADSGPTLGRHCAPWNELMLRPIRSVGHHAAGAPPATLLLPSDTMAEAGVKILRRHMEEFMSREYGLFCCPQDIEFVHEMRVATRRMRAALRAFRSAFGETAREIKTKLSRMAAVLGEARDADVFLTFLREYAEGAPDAHRPFLARFVRSERSRRAHRYRALLAVLKDPEHADVESGLHARVCREPGSPGGLAAGGRSSNRNVARSAPEALRQRLEAVLAYRGPLAERPMEDLHELRIVCKRLRYTSEFLAEIYPNGLDRLTAAALRMQRLLGDVHDADVYIDRIRRYYARARADGSAGPAVGALLAHVKESDKHLAKADSAWRTFSQARTRRKLLAELHAPYHPGAAVVVTVRPGEISVDGKVFASDVTITADGTARKRKKRTAREVYGTAHKLGSAELRKVCRGNPRVLIVGTGYDGGLALAPDGRQYLKQQGIRCVATTTPEAVRLYSEERQPKAAVIHVTC